ncbi:uncharacterized protein LOC111397108 [Olea europaea var. sylvestris]|uniref:uncharacterized protein LOC111397108 n=1 Tax=Olea europaea var. sylvestris TaxID=158386 RepID=UPI000C1D78F2|nr:uncharacterized protein LOC111397108 [Olea europaea var. sylvestris]
MEDKFSDMDIRNLPSKHTFVPNIKPYPSPPLLSTPKIPLSNALINVKSSGIPVKRLSAAEMMERREKGLCFNSDEKFGKGHKCNTKLSVLMLEDEESFDDNQLLQLEGPQENKNIVEEPPPTISFHAMDGQHFPRTLRFTGTITGQKVQILIDGGSTHNFIQERLVQHLRVPVLPSKHFSILVGNGESIACTERCPPLPIWIQQQSFLVNFHILPIRGADVVLGVQWLEQLGPVVMDYMALTMSFHWEGQQVELKDESLIAHRAIHFNQLRRLLTTDAVMCCYQLTSIE